MNKPHEDTETQECLYCREWLIGACAYRLQQQENMRILYVCAYWWLLVCTYFNMYTRAIYRIQITASHLTKMLRTWSRVQSEVSTSAREYDPLLFVRTFNLHAKTETMTFCCVPSGVGLPRLFVRRLAIQSSFKSDAPARAIFVTREHKSTNLTHATSICAK